jgi:hypothetical protein
MSGLLHLAVQCDPNIAQLAHHSCVYFKRFLDSLSEHARPPFSPHSSNAYCHCAFTLHPILTCNLNPTMCTHALARLYH